MHKGRLGRKRHQNGSVFENCGSWRGVYRIHDQAGKGKKRSVTLGRCDEMSEEQAKQKLSQIIHYDDFQSTAQQLIGVSELILPRSDYVTLGVPDIGQRGALSELIVCCDLLSKGFQVFRPVSPHSPCDILILTPDWKTVRVEVKTATPNKDGKVPCDMRRQVGMFDIVAFVFSDGRIEYRKPADLASLRFPIEKEPAGSVLSMSTGGQLSD
jgi:hypothetical protein